MQDRTVRANHFLTRIDVIAMTRDAFSSHKILSSQE